MVKKQTAEKLLRLPPEMLANLKERADREGMNLSQYIRWVLKRELDKK